MSVEMLNLLSLIVYCTSCDSAKNCLKVILVGVLRPGVREQGVKRFVQLIAFQRH